MEPAGQEEGSGAPVEVELKLALDAAAMEAALSSPLLRERARGALRTRELRNTYYDTPDRRLHARKAVLRVREVEGRYVQTLKGARRPDGAVAARNEWEVELPGPEPRPDALDDPDAHELAGLLLPEELAPVFETRVRRRSLVAVWPDAEGRPAEIEVAFDDGVVRADGRGEVPLSELELELLRGDAGALFGLAEALREVVPFRIEPQDKAARGWLLATGEAPPVRKAEPLDLDAGCTVGDALGRILSAALRHWLDNEPAAIAGRQPEGVHQTRVALRRLRSALALFEDALTPEALERWDGELRWLLGTLGPARDLDVLAGDLLPPLLEACGEDAALLAFREAAEAARARARDGVRESLRSQRAGDLAFHLAAWAARRGWREGADHDLLRRQREGVTPFAARVLERRYRHVRKRGKGFAHLAPAERHRLRIALKKLRYGIEFFAGLFPKKRVERFREAATRLQERLGHGNDVDVASRLAHALVEPLGPGRVAEAAIGGGQLVGWYARQAGAVERDTRRAWKKLKRQEPFWADAA
jgi:inorganic triphosphatase YgiF